MTEDIIKLKKNHMKEIMKCSPPQRIHKDTVIVYSSQIPNIAVLVSQGVVGLGEKIYEVGAGTGAMLFLIHEILQKKEICFDVELKAGAVISILDKNLAHELMKRIS